MEAPFHFLYLTKSHTHPHTDSCLLEKLIGIQLAKRFLGFFGIQKFIIARSCYWTPPWTFRSLRLHTLFVEDSFTYYFPSMPKWPLLPGFQTKHFAYYYSPYVSYMSFQSHPTYFDRHNILLVSTCTNHEATRVIFFILLLLSLS
jgi:hypothetical protein